MKWPLEASAEGRGRIVGITDGVFAIALTLIVLEIRVPEHETIIPNASCLPRSLHWRRAS